MEDIFCSDQNVNIKWKVVFLVHADYMNVWWLNQHQMYMKYRTWEIPGGIDIYKNILYRKMYYCCLINYFPGFWGWTHALLYYPTFVLQYIKMYRCFNSVVKYLFHIHTFRFNSQLNAIYIFQIKLFFKDFEDIWSILSWYANILKFPFYYELGWFSQKSNDKTFISVRYEWFLESTFGMVVKAIEIWNG